MLGKLVLIALQIAVAWGAGPFVRQYVPVSGDLDLFVWAGIFAVLVYITGVLAALIIKDVDGPSPAKLTASLVLALIAAAVASFGMKYLPAEVAGTVGKRGLVLAGAVLGYMMRR